MNNNFLPVFSVDCPKRLEKFKIIQGSYGILAPFSCYDKLLHKIRLFDKPFLIDSGVFENKQQAWYYQIHCEFKNARWIRELHLANEKKLRKTIQDYLKRCDYFSPDYVFAPDIIGEPLISLYLARLSLEEYWKQPRSYQLIGVVQVGEILYNWTEKSVPSQDSFLPYYNSPKSFLSSLISEYRNMGYKYVALGGLLKPDKTRRTGLKFGLSIQEFDDLLTWSRPDFVLGGLALTRLDILKKHKVWADSTGWLWWNACYDEKFKDRNPLQEVINFASESSGMETRDHPVT
ncbi:hypothetical protein VB715_19480 [Crocosphaera sp. UHCC 0190]|uniref:hypothetical protein n=1 Tax=Crocosphaera sp. UHCC 0190 TaxID=3110246 RepID=UPI002B20B8B5|nr:hypothetical protein [Crocosphaera sp. UHCC 0190]MEA5511958.1 hypothetical protein [Crocosphaera sp. UHCC 0190]